MTEHVLEPPTQLDRAEDPATSGATNGRGDARSADEGAERARDGTAAPAEQMAAAEQMASAVQMAAPEQMVAPEASCTQAQIRRFIKSRPYVPLHELRRRFGLNGSDDDVSPVDVDGHRLFVGLPARESGLLGDLLRQGDVGYELLLDPTSPIIIGVFPMRPVQRS